MIGAVIVGAFSGVVVVGLWLLYLRWRHMKYVKLGPPGPRLSESSDIGDPLVRAHRNARKLTDPNRRKR